MSNIKEAIAQAAHDALKSYLAPELVEQLTEEIIQRAAPQMEEALRAMAGFELGRPGAVRSKPTPAPQRKLGKKRRDDEAEKTPAYLTGSSDAPNHIGHGAETAPMHLS